MKKTKKELIEILNISSKKNDELADEIKTLSFTNDEMLKRVEELEQLVHDIKDKNRILIKEDDDKRLVIERQKRELETAESSNDKLNEEVKALTHSNREMRNDMADLEHLLNEIKDVNSNLIEKNSKRGFAIERQREEVRTAKKNLDFITAMADINSRNLMLLDDDLKICFMNDRLKEKFQTSSGKPGYFSNIISGRNMDDCLKKLHRVLNENHTASSKVFIRLSPLIHRGSSIHMTPAVYDNRPAVKIAMEFNQP